jgi:hypothetical protein
MKILASSVHLTQVVETFLHAGYGSAFPRTLIQWGRGLPRGGRPRMQLELTEALRLEGENLASAATSTHGESSDAAIGVGAGLLDSVQGQLLAGIVVFFGGLALFYLLRSQHHRLALLRPRAAALALALLAAPLLVGWQSADRSETNRAPWDGVPRRQYANPKLATQALMQIVIADALANTGKAPAGYEYARLKLTSLAQIQPEVGLPTGKLTDGMRYALKTYGLDGWGRPFRVRGRWGYGFRITSAGQDGELGTRDDLKTRVYLDKRDAWESRRRAFFLREVGGELVVLFHRSKMRTFRFHDEKRARAVTKTKLFDLIPVSKLPERQQKRLRRIYEAASKQRKAPLVALAF